MGGPGRAERKRALTRVPELSDMSEKAASAITVRDRTDAAPSQAQVTPKPANASAAGTIAWHAPHVVTCSQCRSPRLAHKACPVCGTYRGREVLQIPDPDLEG